MDQLGERGQAIWDAYGASNLDAGSQALIREYARLADTAERIAGLAAGRKETWASLVFDDMGEVHLSIDKLLDQQRNTQLAIKALFGEMRQAGIRPAVAGRFAASPADDETPLERRRREKAERERKSG